MNEVTVIEEAVAAFAATAAGLGAATAAAGGINTAAQSAAMTAAFGLIGQEFLLAFGLAQANHLRGIGQLAAVHAGTALATHAGLAEFGGVDAANAARIGAR